MAKTPPGFPDDELLALLCDASVSVTAIAAEMEDAGAPPFSVEKLAAARVALEGLREADADRVAALPAPLRALVLDQVVAREAVALALTLSASADKAVAKEGKRAVHRLRAKGLAVETPKPPPAPARGPAAAPASASAGEPGALLSNVDGFGERIVLLTRPARQGVDLAHLAISETEGVLQARLLALARREFRRFLKGLSEAEGVLVGAVPRSYARGLVTQALDQNARARRAVPAGYQEVAFVLGPPEPPTPSPGRTLSLPEDESALARRAAELIAIREMRTWLPEEEPLQHLALKIEEIQVSALYLDEAQRQKGLRSAVDDAVRDYWTRERRRRAAERLFDLGYLLNGAKRLEHAALALACALDLDSDRPVESVTFCYALFERILSAVGAKGAGPVEKTSPGGLILP